MKQCTPSPRESIADIDPIVVRQIAAELTNCGIDPGLALDGVGFSADHLADEDFYVSYRQTSHVVRRAMHLLEDRHLGMRLGSNVNLVTWGTCYMGLLGCADSHELLSFAADFLPCGLQLMELRYDDSPQGGPCVIAQARFDEPAVTSFLVENAFAALVHACRNVLGPSYGPVAVDLAIARPENPLIHTQAFGCSVNFAQAESRVQFPPERVAIKTADSLAVRRARRELTLQLTETWHSHELESSVVQALQGRFDDPPPLSAIANSMHLSERTLRRRLAELGLGYADLLDRERKRRALALIRGRQRTLNQVAIDTGFADVRSLRRAVKRWTGKSPTEVKREA